MITSTEMPCLSDPGKRRSALMWGTFVLRFIISTDESDQSVSAERLVARTGAAYRYKTFSVGIYVLKPYTQVQTVTESFTNIGQARRIL